MNAWFFFLWYLYHHIMEIMVVLEFTFWDYQCISVSIWPFCLKWGKYVKRSPGPWYKNFTLRTCFVAKGWNKKFSKIESGSIELPIICLSVNSLQLGTYSAILMSPLVRWCCTGLTSPPVPTSTGKACSSKPVKKLVPTLLKSGLLMLTTRFTEDRCQGFAI